MDEYSEEFRMNLKFYREQKGWSQADLQFRQTVPTDRLVILKLEKLFPHLN